MLKKTIQLGQQLTKQEMKEIKGGKAQDPPSIGVGSGNCGVKDKSGTWHEIIAIDSSGTKQHAMDLVYNGDGTFTNYCCDSCSWNTATAVA
jgi:hypothetical protein